MQELWLMLIELLHDARYDPSRGDFRDGITAAARHRLVDQERSRWKHAMEHLGPEVANSLTGREPDPTESFERKRLGELVLDALADLRDQVSSRDDEAFTLRWVEGLTVREIARRLGMTEQQVWSSHHRTSRKLRVPLVRRVGPDFLAFETVPEAPAGRQHVARRQPLDGDPDPNPSPRRPPNPERRPGLRGRLGESDDRTGTRG